MSTLDLRRHNRGHTLFHFIVVLMSIGLTLFVAIYQTLHYGPATRSACE